MVIVIAIHHDAALERAPKLRPAPGE
jgi:hypothetical protein